MSPDADTVVTPAFITFVSDTYIVLESDESVSLSLENTGGLDGTACKL